jgi:methionyl-tRNA synthetase
MENVKYDEFKKMELKTGKILKVEDHPAADKLYLVTVDLGNETRMLVAGIKPYYTKEDLIGKTAVVLANLEPRVIRGIESKGMLLAALAGDTLGIVTVDRDLPAGTGIS